ncbi:MAG: TonB-dependent receptor [Verrucomicrobia bacterium]|nr:TonB-dependent receptor [Verrucomicrobiota bacterium]
MKIQTLYRSALARRSFRRLALAASAATLALPGSAQTATNAAPASASASAPVVLSPVVVTATRTPTPVEATAASVTLITRADLDAAGYSDAADALRDVPGLYYASPGPGAAAGRVLMRGTPSRHTLVLLDGRRLPAGLAGNFDLANLLMSSVDRIEVVRGSSSALNGGNALGGVINLLTHCPSPGERVARVSTEAGSFGTVAGDAFVSAAEGSLNASVGVGASRTDNDRAHNATERGSARASLGWQATTTLYADVAATYFRSDAELPNSTTVNDRFATLRTEVYSVSPGLRLKTGENLTQSLFYAATTQELNPRGFVAYFPSTPGRSGGANGTTTIDGGQLDYQADWRTTETLQLTAGAAWLRNESERFNDGTGDVPFGTTVPGVDVTRTEESRAVFAQAQWEALKDVNLIQALRHESAGDYGDHTTWRSGASWRAPVTRTLVRASYATAFAAPSVQDTATAFFGNPALKAETARSWEAGVEQALAGERVTLGATYFHNRIDDLIVYDPGSFSLDNVARSTNQGLELAAAWTPVAAVSVRADYTYLEQDAENDALGLSYIGRPKHVFQNTLIWKPVAAVSWTLGVRHVRGVEEYAGAAQPSYTVVRTAVQWAWREDLTVFARIENLFDADYAEIPGFPANPTGYYLGLKWSL